MVRSHRHARRVSAACLALGWAAPACSPPEEGAAVPEPQMDALALLTRASLDLRGVRPSEAELDRVEASPEDLAAVLDEFLVDERFPSRVEDLLAPVYRTRIDFYNALPESYGFNDDQAALFYRAIGDEALKVVGEIARRDLPYTDLVTGDWTMADETLARVYPVDYPAGGAGWQAVHYTDGRPVAGVLATNNLWWRYGSSAENFNRGRTNALSRMLLCADYLERPVVFDRSGALADSGDLEAAASENAGCINCHASLDPVGSYLYGFWYFDAFDVSPEYHPEREQLWQSLTGVSPGYYGQPGYGLADLGRQVASDTRFVECGVETVYEALLQREAGASDAERLTAHREAFLSGGVTLRALVRSVVSDPRYRAGDTSADGYVPWKMATPELLASQVEDLTGYRMTWMGYDLLQTDAVGLRTLAGGLDGITVNRPADRPTASVVLVQERLAEAASAWVVSQDMKAPQADRRLFGAIDFTETPDGAPEAVITQVQALHRRLFGRRVDADSEQVAAAVDLFRELLAAGSDVPGAWTGVLSFLLRDPDLLLY